VGWGQRLDWGQLLVSMKCRRRLTPWSGESFNRKVGRMIHACVSGGLNQ
jgi:hypothetical protein